MHAALKAGAEALRTRGGAILLTHCCQDNQEDVDRLRAYFAQRFGEDAVATRDDQADVNELVKGSQIVVALVGRRFLRQDERGSCAKGCRAHAEVAASLRQKRIIIPVMVGTAGFPSDLPPNVAGIANYQAYLVYDTTISGQMTLPGQLVAAVLARRPKRNRLIGAAIGLGMLLLVVAVTVVG